MLWSFSSVLWRNTLLSLILLSLIHSKTEHPIALIATIFIYLTIAVAVHARESYHLSPYRIIPMVLLPPGHLILSLSLGFVYKIVPLSGS